MAFYSKMIVIRAASVNLLLLLNLALICESLSAVVKPVISRKTEDNNEIISNRWSSPLCGQLSFEGSNGTFSSPNYPASYNRDNLDCRYVIDVSAVINSSRILLTFSDFATEAGYDYVEIYEGQSIQFSPRIAVFSGDRMINPTPTLSNSPYMIVRFSTDATASNYRGFSANWTALA